MIAAVTFDVDGTLYDTQAVRWAMVWRNRKRLRAMRLGLRVRDELRARAFADGEALRAEEARLVAERLETSPDKARAVLDAVFDETLCACLPRVAAPALPPLLVRLAARGVKLGAVSDRRIDDKLTALGLHGAQVGAFIQARICADDTGLLKPDVRMLQRAADVLGVHVRDVVHIGDRDPLDGDMARAAGARFILVRSVAETCRVVEQLLGELDEIPPTP